MGLGCHGEAQKALLDAGRLIQELTRRPTHVSKLVDWDPDYVGFCHVSAFGASGVWFSGNKSLAPSVGRFEFPPDIMAQVILGKNPTGIMSFPQERYRSRRGTCVVI
jgi:hypothetical protein